MVMLPDGSIYERVETLYVSDDYKAFLLTGQTNGGSRRGFVSVKPFNQLEEAQLAAMKEQAKPITPDARLTISTVGSNISIYDGYTGTDSTYAVALLDADVQQRIGNQQNSAWEKYGARKPAAAPVRNKFAP